MMTVNLRSICEVGVLTYESNISKPITKPIKPINDNTTDDDILYNN